MIKILSLIDALTSSLSTPDIAILDKNLLKYIKYLEASITYGSEQKRRKILPKNRDTKFHKRWPVNSVKE